MLLFWFYKSWYYCYLLQIDHFSWDYVVLWCRCHMLSLLPWKHSWSYICRCGSVFLTIPIDHNTYQWQWVRDVNLKFIQTSHFSIHSPSPAQKNSYHSYCWKWLIRLMLFCIGVYVYKCGIHDVWCKYTCMSMKARGGHGCPNLPCSLFYSFEPRAHLVENTCQWPSCLCPPQCWGYRHGRPCLAFFHES